MIYWEQFKSVLIHKWYVLLAGRLVGVPLWRLIIHDWSKFTPTEFFGYAGNPGDSRNKNKWARAWLHHLHCNPHHPEHWVLSWLGNPEFYNETGQKVAQFVTILPMPETYVKEMIADMMATSKKITGSWDISAWLNQKGPNMHLHEETIVTIVKVIKKTEYISVNDCDWLWRHDKQQSMGLN